MGFHWTGRYNECGLFESLDVKRLRFLPDLLLHDLLPLLHYHSPACQRNWLDVAASAADINRYNRFADVPRTGQSLMQFHLQRNGFCHPGYDCRLVKDRQFLRPEKVGHGHRERQSSYQSYARLHPGFQVSAEPDTFPQYPRNTFPDPKHNPVAEKPLPVCFAHQMSWCPNKFPAKECLYLPMV